MIRVLAAVLAAFLAVGTATGQESETTRPDGGLTVTYLSPGSFAATSRNASPTVKARKAARPARYFTTGTAFTVRPDTPSIDFGAPIGVARLSKVIRRAPGDFTWVGTIVGTDERVLLVVRGGTLTGSIARPAGNSEILSLGGSLHALIDLSTGSFPVDERPGLLPRGGSRAVIDPAADRLYADGESPVVDVLVGYTTAAKTAYGGDMDAYAQAAIDASNLAYTDSGISAQLRLAGTFETSYAGSFDAALNDMRLSTNGFETLGTLRDQLGADLVSLMINDTAYCGLGYLNSSSATAFTTVYWSCAVGNFSFAHEIGHNFGAQHDTYVAAGQGVYTYGYGYVYKPDRWRTIMAYNNDCSASGYNCTRIGRFSTPLKTYNAVVTGTAESADNTRVHNERAATLAAFKTPPSLSLTVDRTGEGTITSSPAGISCGATCVGSFEKYSTVTLTATADASTSFTGWTGACTGAASTCTVTMSAARQVGATFDTVDATLSVGVFGTGSGSVSVEPAGDTCTLSCDYVLPVSTEVTLTAIAGTDSVFSGWSSGCTGTNTVCSFSLAADTTATADFAEASTLTVTRSGGDSTARIISSPAGISCGSTCTAKFATTQTVTLTALPGSNSVFQGWTGACSGSATTCTVSMTMAESVTGTFTLAQRLLTVAKTGNGSGTVTSSPAGIACGSTCTRNFNHGTVVTLTASPAANMEFAGWSSSCTGTASTCTVTMTAAKTVRASFVPVKRTLTLSKLGAGTGTVTSSPAGISCGAVCTTTFDHGTSVVLTARPASNMVFAGWSGACSGTATTCTVSMTASKAVRASFLPAMRELLVVKGGAGSGSVVSSPSGINCGTDCLQDYAHGTSVTLTARPAADSVFDRWSGACTGTTATCTVAMAADRTVTANFKAKPALTVLLVGSGSGSVKSSPSGIACGTTCSARFVPGATVTLTATPTTGSTFVKWSGACSGTVRTCSVALTSSKTATATFAPNLAAR